MSLTILIISFVWLLITSIIFHEIGHLIILKQYGFNVKLEFYADSIRRFGIKTCDKNIFRALNNRQKRTVGGVGVFFGVIPILLFGLLDNSFYILALAPYFLGCINDFEIIYETYKVKV